MSSWRRFIGTVAAAAVSLGLMVLLVTDRAAGDWLMALVLLVAAAVGSAVGERSRVRSGRLDDRAGTLRTYVLWMLALAGVLVLQVLLLSERTRRDWVWSGVVFLVIAALSGLVESLQARGRRRRAGADGVVSG